MYEVPTDPTKLEELFHAAVIRWRAYRGDKPSGSTLATINAVYRQATQGDCPTQNHLQEGTQPQPKTAKERRSGAARPADPPPCNSAFDAAVEDKWRGLRGYRRPAMQRRYLALLRDVDPTLLRGDACDDVPWGFPTVDEGTGRGSERICPYANSVKGCPHRLMDRHGHYLDREIQENETLRGFAGLKAWLEDAAREQRCRLGLHRPITDDQAKPFATFFARPQCGGGFKPYVAAHLHGLVEAALTRNLAQLVDLQERFVAASAATAAVGSAAGVGSNRDGSPPGSRGRRTRGSKTVQVLLSPPPPPLQVLAAAASWEASTSAEGSVESEGHGSATASSAGDTAGGGSQAASVPSWTPVAPLRSGMLREQLLLQRERMLTLQMCYEQLTGSEYRRELPCKRTTHLCEGRRLADGANHTHPVDVVRPTADLSEYDGVLALRDECTRLGVKPTTGPVRTMEQRARILSEKIADVHRRRMLVYESRRRQQWRRRVRPAQLASLSAAEIALARERLAGRLDRGDLEGVLALVARGADPDAENRWGLFPLLLAVAESAPAAAAEVLAAGGDVNRRNCRGVTALAWAARREDFVMCQRLLEAGADPADPACIVAAVRAGRAEILDAFKDHLSKNADAAAAASRVSRALNQRIRSVAAASVGAKDGGTALMAAANARNWPMCRHLLRLGADPAIRDPAGATAADHAAARGWRDLAGWLRQTRAVGKSGIFTPADLLAEAQGRVAAVRLAAAIDSGDMVAEAARSPSLAAPLLSRIDEAADDSALPTQSPQQPDGAAPSSGTAGAAARKDSSFKLLRQRLGSLAAVDTGHGQEAGCAAAGPGKDGSQLSSIAAVDSAGLKKLGPANDVLQRHSVSLDSNPLSNVAASAAPPSDNGSDNGSSGNDVSGSSSSGPPLVPRALLVIRAGQAWPDLETEEGRTALATAAYRGQDATVAALLREGCDANYANRNGRTALMAAAAAGHTAVVFRLLAAGAAADVTDLRGATAAVLAHENGHGELAAALAVAASSGVDSAAAELLAERAERRQREEAAAARDAVVAGLAGLAEAGLADRKRVEPVAALSPLLAAAGSSARFWPERRVSKGDGMRSGARASAEEGGEASAPAAAAGSVSLLRCPKCTLSIPCAHFAGPQRLREAYPDGPPEWRWEKRPVNSRPPPPEGYNRFKRQDGGDGVDIRALFNCYRDKILPKAPGEHVGIAGSAERPQ